VRSLAILKKKHDNDLGGSKMNLGMLWFDNDPKTELAEKIKTASTYYRKKYGSSPNLCVVNPNMTNGKKLNAGNVEVETSKSILPNHLWIGINGTVKKIDPSD
jgi:hypothetical protein